MVYTLPILKPCSFRSEGGMKVGGDALCHPFHSNKQFSILISDFTSGAIPLIQYKHNQLIYTNLHLENTRK